MGFQEDETGQTGGNTVAPKRVDFGYNALGQFTSIARYKDTSGGTGNEVATSTFTYDTLARLTGLAYSKERRISLHLTRGRTTVSDRPAISGDYPKVHMIIEMARSRPLKSEDGQ